MVGAGRAAGKGGDRSRKAEGLQVDPAHCQLASPVMSYKTGFERYRRGVPTKRVKREPASLRPFLAYERGPVARRTVARSPQVGRRVCIAGLVTCKQTVG